MPTVSILYHDVVRSGAFDSSGFLLSGADRYKLESDEFERHLQAIEDEIGSRPTLLTEGPVESQNQRWLITFDDGGVSGYTVIADMLERYDWRGHFFVTTDFIDTSRFLSRGQIRELRERGHLVGSHSSSHPAQISRCNQPQLKKEWTDSVKKLEDILGEPVRLASVPGGFYSRQVADEAFAAGVRILFTSEPTMRPMKVNDLFILGRYTIKRGTSSREAAGLASGNRQLRFEQLLRWRAMSVIKAIGGKRYAKVRNMLLSRDSRSSDTP
jgi:peptidoglycan/xylan/chitin deacetylase (PgdA/CDA1 family)